MHSQHHRVIVLVEHHKSGASVGPLEGGHQDIIVRAVHILADLDRVGHEEFTEVAHRVEEGLLVVLVSGGIHNNGRVHIVAHPVWSTLEVEHQVPVSPAAGKMVQV